MCRLAATAVTVALLAINPVTDHPGLLAALAVAYGLGSSLAFARVPALSRLPAAWLVDTGLALGLVLACREWRSPAYLLALTTLILPATTLPFRRALVVGPAFTLTYAGIALSLDVSWTELNSAGRIEGFVTHLLVPVLVAVSLGYSARLLTRLREERGRAERMAIEAERRRIGWELHDSAKQRIHAANLVLSAAAPHADARAAAAIEQAIGELECAVADMETSLSDLRAPLEAGGLGPMLRERAAALASATSATITVAGDTPELAPVVAAHAYRIATEALTNAVRHAGAGRVEVELRADADLLSIVVRDDGGGLPAEVRPGASGLAAMRHRARSIGADLVLEPDEHGRGTTVRLEIPLPGATVALEPQGALA